ncbi:RNA-directed DNA polymerase from [Plakobranchus ocellatus]|uniref:RNA-directed DNA polymerase from n=1 Tax=Plakobranchus ocellatus TaxID=259542 RepID=A0AAV4C9R2_9GAST|nr:RNA-directed DNA polymerase from [Plakobranchus ocellatus]
MSSYRPISLTSHLGKVLETIINKRLTYHLEANNLISDTQAGFRKDRQTLDQIVALENSVKVAKTNSRTVGAIFLDLEKAYDTMWREGLLMKLKKLGIKGLMYNYIANFNRDRTFQVRVGSSLSSIKKQINSIPQGAVISPTLGNSTLIGSNNRVETHPPSLIFNTKKADWAKFQKLLNDAGPTKAICNHQHCENVLREIKSAALEAIPHNQHQRKIRKNNIKYSQTTNKYWWDETCQNAVNERKIALKELTKNNTQENITNFRMKRNKATAVIKKTKKAAWRNFVNNINIRDNPKKAWDQINSMRGTKLKSKKVASLENQNNSKFAANDKDKAELLCKQFEYISSDGNLEPEFMEIKNKAKKDKYKLLAKEVCRYNIDYYNLPISLKEIQEVLDNKKKSAPGEDAITYEIINQTPPSFKLKILALFNAIWISSNIPKQFKHAVVIPIYKQGKDKKDPGTQTRD